jgi:hypothetical protein
MSKQNKKPVRHHNSSSDGYQDEEDEEPLDIELTPNGPPSSYPPTTDSSDDSEEEKREEIEKMRRWFEDEWSDGQRSTWEDMEEIADESVSKSEFSGPEDADSSSAVYPPEEQ